MSTRPPLLLIRADAGTKMGAGHVMRTVALAQAWMDEGGAARMVAASLPEGLETRLVEEGVEVERMRGGAGAAPDAGTSEDARRLRERAEEIGAAAVVIDGYQFGVPFRRELAGLEATTLLVQDYGLDEPLEIDLLLNQNPHARPELYPEAGRTRLLLGLEWAMLRREFRDAAGRSGPAPSGSDGVPGAVTLDGGTCRVFVTMGGGDPDDVTGLVLRGLARVSSPLEITALIGAANPHQPRLEELAARAPHSVRLIRNATDVPALMLASDLAVSAAGSTSWELAYLGVPWLSVALADNQCPIREALGQQGLAVDLGWHEALDEATVSREVQALLDDPERRQAMAERARRAVDGEGAVRVARLLRRARS